MTWLRRSIYGLTALALAFTITGATVSTPTASAQACWTYNTGTTAPSNAGCVGAGQVTTTPQISPGGMCSYIDGGTAIFVYGPCDLNTVVPSQPNETITYSVPGMA